MEDIILSLVAITAGALFCFVGYLAFRLIIPLWGAFAGFAFGAGFVSSVTGDGFLRTLLGWAVGLACALAFALVAYLFYEVAVVIAMGSIGFALGTSLMVALHVSWTWLIVLFGVAAGVLLAIVAIAAELPMVLLIVLSALGGASAITMGVMLLVGSVDSADFTEGGATKQIDAGWWWYVLYGGLALMGIVTQLRGAVRVRGSMREAWADGRS